MTLDFSKWDGIDFNDLGTEGDFPEIPYGTYEVKVNNIELKESKKGSLMIVFEFEIINGDFEKSRLWYNQ
ncbi:DUF669 domain-containing protein, partial [Streptococcus danieliae]|nr:DUF669 domain-containing protein [Streptococcus danieliae]